MIIPCKHHSNMEAPFSAKFKFSIEIGRMSDFLVESGIQYIQMRYNSNWQGLSM